MIIKVISLQKSIYRRQYIHKELSKLDLIYEFENAVKINSWSDAKLKIGSKKNFQLRYNRFPKLGEIGCSISHNLVRKKFVEKNNKQTLMVLEDDAKIVCTKSELFSVIKFFKKSKFDILILGYSKCDDDYEKHLNIINPILPIYKTNKILIGPRYLCTTSGTVGYVIKKKSAKKMLKIFSESILADDWDFFSKSGLKIAHTSPMLIRENYQNLVSTLNRNNYSLKFKNSKNFIINFLLKLRKFSIGLLRRILLKFRYF